MGHICLFAPQDRGFDDSLQPAAVVRSARVAVLQWCVVNVENLVRGKNDQVGIVAELD